MVVTPVWVSPLMIAQFTGAEERTRRTGEAIDQIRTAHGDDAVLQAVEIEPWSSLPERRWALVPYDVSISPDRSS